MSEWRNSVTMNSLIGGMSPDDLMSTNNELHLCNTCMYKKRMKGTHTVPIQDLERCDREVKLCQNI